MKSVYFNKEQVDNIENFLNEQGCGEYLNDNYVLLPSFCDVHVHFREPGFEYKETIKSGSMAAARGGFTKVMTMPNLKPVPDSATNIKKQLDIIKNTSVINVYPYASITIGQKGEELTDFSALKDYAIAFSDDGKGIQEKSLMEKAMRLAKENGKMIVAHCEDNSLLFNGYIHKGEYALKHGHRGICSESEYAQIARDLELASKIGVSYHVCHISTKESVEIIRQAKNSGVDVSCETAPHYLILDDSNLQEHGRFKMNPPIRSESDKLALIEGVKDGTIEMIATDHAPHSFEEKSKGLEKSAFGVVGIETSFASLYTHLVMNNVISLDKLIGVMAINPRKRFKLNLDNEFTIFDLKTSYKVDPKDFVSMGKATPFEGMEFYGVCKLTALNGKVIYKN